MGLVAVRAATSFGSNLNRRMRASSLFSNSGSLSSVPTKIDPTFEFEVVTQCPNVPSEILIPEESWHDRSAYGATARKLADLFIKNFLTFESGVSAAVKAAGPK